MPPAPRHNDALGVAAVSSRPERRHVQFATAAGTEKTSCYGSGGVSSSSYEDDRERRRHLKDSTDEEELSSRHSTPYHSRDSSYSTIVWWSVLVECFGFKTKLECFSDMTKIEWTIYQNGVPSFNAFDPSLIVRIGSCSVITWYGTRSEEKFNFHQVLVLKFIYICNKIYCFSILRRINRDK